MQSPYKNAALSLGGVPIEGMNRAFVGMSGVSALTSAMGGASSFMQNAWDDDPNKFAQLGQDAGTFAEEAAGLGLGMYYLGAHARTTGLGLKGMGTSSGAYVASGDYAGTWRALSKGGWERVGGAGIAGKAEATEEVMKNLLKNKGNFNVHVRGNSNYAGGWRGAGSRMMGTYKPMGWKGNALMMGAQVAMMVAAPMALGFAGRVLDDAYSESKHFRRPHYDNRFFNTRQYDMSSYQQLGAAMDNYENRMMSVARIYHAR